MATPRINAEVEAGSQAFWQRNPDPTGVIKTTASKAPKTAKGTSNCLRMPCIQPRKNDTRTQPPASAKNTFRQYSEPSVPMPVISLGSISPLFALISQPVRGSFLDDGLLRLGPAKA